MKALKINPTINNFLTLVMMAFAITTAITVNTDAQGRKLVTKRNQKAVARQSPTESKADPAEKIVNISAATPASPAVTVLNTPQADFLSGEANVTVNPQQPTVIRLGLAQNAVSIVEFPASDGIYYIHEGNPKLASVFQSPTKETDRSITIYPGEGLVPSRDGSMAAAISLQMRSGLVLILELVPVTDIKRNAHRCVINYDRDAVVAARKVAGLAYNLGGESSNVSPINSRASSKLVGAIQSNESTSADTPKLPDNPISNAAYTELAERRRGSSKVTTLSDADISKVSNKRLADALKDPKKNLGSWSAPVNGLELSVSRVSDLDADDRLVIVAVRNSTSSNLRLVPGSPELQIQTLDKDGNSLLTSRVEIRYLETTSVDGIVMPGSTSFYALVYKAPTLGVNQKIRVTVAHKDAADSPVAASLGGSK